VDEERPSVDYYDEPEGTEERPRRKVIPEEEVPPPPRDWISHPVTRAILWLILLAAVVGLIWKTPEWITYMREHPFGASLAGILILVAIFILFFSYWRYRAKGWVGQSNWDTRRKRKTK